MAKGTFALTDVKVTGSPAKALLVDQLAPEEKASPLEIMNTDYTIEQGTLSYEDMPMRLGKLEVHMAGRINQKGTLELDVTAPFPESIRSKNATLAEYLPKQLLIPLTGTFGLPRLDIPRAVQQSVTGASKKAAQEKAGDLMKGAGALGGGAAGAFKKIGF